MDAEDCNRDEAMNVSDFFLFLSRKAVTTQHGEDIIVVVGAVEEFLLLLQTRRETVISRTLLHVSPPQAPWEMFKWVLISNRD